MANLLSKKGWVRIGRMFTLGIDRYQAIVAVPIKKRDFLSSLQNFEGQTAGIVPGNTADDAQALRINRRCEVMLKRPFPGGGQWQLESRKILADVANGYRVTRTLPISTQVRMPAGCSRRGFRFGRF